MIARNILQQPKPIGLALQSIADIELQQATSLFVSLLVRPHREWQELLRSIHPALNSFNLPIAIETQHVGPKTVSIPLWRRIVKILYPHDSRRIVVDRPVPTSWMQWLQEPLAFNKNILYPSKVSPGPIKADWLAHNGISTVQQLMHSSARLTGGQRAFTTTLQDHIRKTAHASTTINPSPATPKRQKLPYIMEAITPHDPSYSVHRLHTTKLASQSSLTPKQADAHLLLSHNKLPCSDSLQDRFKDWVCPLCGSPQDSTQHALITCPEIPSILKRSKIPPLANLQDLPRWLATPDKHKSEWSAISKIIHKRKKGRITTLKTRPEPPCEGPGKC